MFLSFIVPIYNVERFLSACLDSLLRQDIPTQDYEIICVDDGSTDASSDILRKYKIKHDNLSVIHQENGGVCRARNVGLEIATGDYVWLVDADDCVQPNCLGMLKKLLAEDNLDRLIIDNYSFPETANPYTCENKRENTAWHDSVAWRNVFRRSFLAEHELRFRYPELVYGEDALFMYEVKYRQPRTAFSNMPLYYCRERSGSASRENTEVAEQRRLHSTIREAEILRDYYNAGRTDQVTADRLMSYLYGALFHIAAMPKETAKRELAHLRKAELFPFHRPKNCTIRKSFYVNRGGDAVEKIHDFIYCRINTRRGYYAMRSWNAAFGLKHRLLHKGTEEQ